MRLSALDIKKQEFKKSIRGYDVGEVEAYLDTVSNEVEQLYRENQQLKEKIEGLEKENSELKDEVNIYKENEKTFQKAIVKSQDMAEDVLENANRRADLIMKEAEILVSKTRLSAREEIVDLKQELNELRIKTENIIDEVKNFLIEKLNSIDEYSRNRKILRLETNIEPLTEITNEQPEVPPDYGMNLELDESK